MNKKATILTFIGVVAGAVAGYIYYHFIGCQTGACPLTSQPIPTTLYGAFTGGLIFNSITGSKKQGPDR